MKNKLSCIFIKLCSLILISISIAFVPIQLHFGMSDSFFVISFMSIVSLIFLSIGISMLIKTNNPISRYNPFSINPKWKNKMDHSISENPGQLFQYEPVDENMMKVKNRNNKINDLLK